MTLDKTLISAGLTANFGLTGTLTNYPTVSHDENFSLYVLQTICIPASDNFKYKVGDPASTLGFEIE